MTTKTTEVVKREEQSIETAGTLVEVIARAAIDPRVDVEKMERLLAMQEKVMDRQARVAFHAALARIQADMPSISQRGNILDKHGNVRSHYATYPDIDRVLRPMMAEEGFSVSFDNTTVKDSRSFIITCTLRHRDGHAERQQFPVIYEETGRRSKDQDIASSHNFARRQLLKSWFNIVEEGDDVPGEGLKPIDEEQARELNSMLDELSGDRAKNLTNFLALMKVAKIEDIPRGQYTRATTALDARRRRG